MKEIIRTNDIALISFVEAVLTEAQIAFFVADAHTSVVEGSIGALPRRILVDPSREDAARRLLGQVGLGAELRSKK